MAQGDIGSRRLPNLLLGAGNVSCFNLQIVYQCKKKITNVQVTHMIKDQTFKKKNESFSQTHTIVCLLRIGRRILMAEIFDYKLAV